MSSSPSFDDRAQAIAAFWSWWSYRRVAVEHALDAGQGLEPSLTAELVERIAEIDPALSWGLESTAPGQHALTVTPSGVSELYATAARWWEAAPETNGWRYQWQRAARPDAASLTFRLSGRDVALGEVRFAISRRNELVDVRVDHPQLRSLESPAAMAAAFQLLDAAIGERAVERYLGAVDVRRVWRGGSDVRELYEVFKALHAERRAIRTQGNSVWLFLDSSRDGWRGLTTVDALVRQVDHPTFDWRADVRLKLLEPRDDGLTTNAEGEALGNLEDVILSRLGSDAVFTSRETHRGHRTVRLAFDGQTPVAEWLGRLRDSDAIRWPIEVETLSDPGWTQAREILHAARMRPAR
jgi:hypothetical protein